MFDWLRRNPRSKRATATESANLSDTGPDSAATALTVNVPSAAADARDALPATPRRAGGATFHPDPDTADSGIDRHVKLGVALNEQGKFQEAELHWDRALSLEPKLATGHYGLGLARVGQGRRDDGMQSLRRALELKPDYEAAYLSLCLALFQSGRTKEARQVVEQGLSILPHSADLHFYEGNVRHHARDLDGAITCYERALSHRPAFAEAHNNLGQVYSKQKKLDEALNHFVAALTINPKFGEAHSGAGNVLMEQGRLDAATAHFRQAMEMAPGYAPAYVGLGSALEKQGRTEEARAYLDRAVALGPGNAGANAGFAWDRGRLDEAIRYYEQAVALAPDDVEMHVLMGNALFKRGESTRALASFERALSLEPGHAVVHLVNALTGRNSERAPDQYVESLFDGYAEKFDSELTQVLGYSVPQQLAVALRELEDPADAKWNVLDLGCGTGLSGVAVSRFARLLVGVDLSEKMLEKAKARNVYHRLERSNLLAMIQNEAPSTYDLVLAADVFIYVGRLDELVNQVHRVLREGALFAFSVESLDALAEDGTTPTGGGEYRLTQTARYAQSRSYLSRLAAENRFLVHRMTDMHVRTNAGKPVSGYLALWRKMGPTRALSPQEPASPGAPGPDTRA